MIELFRDLVPEEKRDQAIEKLDELIDDAFEKAKKAASTPRSTPQVYPVLPDLEQEWAEAQRERDQALGEDSGRRDSRMTSLLQFPQSAARATPVPRVVRSYVPDA